MGPYFTFYVPWLIVLPFIGAGAAFWSQCAGGGVLHRLLAALAPVLIWLGLVLIALPISLIVDRGVPLALKATAVGAFLVSWVLLPGMLLLLGATPFLRRRPLPA
jgi:hypothetical protein